MSAKTGRFFVGVGCKHPVATRKAVLMSGSAESGHYGSKQKLHISRRNRLALTAAVRKVPDSAIQLGFVKRQRDVNFLRGVSECRRYVSVQEHSEIFRIRARA